jgi:tRNA(Arg) A34 adenosine deaminase TadA
MQLVPKHLDLLKQLMRNSAQKGNLANSGVVLEDGKLLASAESLVVSDHNATAHSERMLVEQIGKIKQSNYTPGLQIVTVVEPCIMCMSACSQAGYSEVYYIIPAKKYLDKIAWMADSTSIDKSQLGQQFSNPLKLVHLAEYEDEFSSVFEEVMSEML